MKFMLGGNPVPAECALEIFPSDTLMQDFKEAPYSDYSSFFEVTSFELGIDVHEDDESHSAFSQQARLGKQNSQSSTQPMKAKGVPFARWRSATRDEAERIARSYPVEFKVSSFERLIDAASPIFVERCLRSQKFDSAVLVKRISQGPAGGTPRPTVGYLRIDFTDVLITGIEWTDGDLVKEKCEFICNRMDFRYRVQKTEGTVSASGEVGASWINDRAFANRRGGGRS